MSLQDEIFVKFYGGRMIGKTALARAAAVDKMPRHDAKRVKTARAKDGLVQGYSLKGQKGVTPIGGSEYILIHNGAKAFGPASHSECEKKSMELSRGPQDRFKIVRKETW